MATYRENSCSFGLRYVSWYKCLIVGLVFSRLGFWSGNLSLIAPFPDLCLLVLFYGNFAITRHAYMCKKWHINKSGYQKTCKILTTIAQILYEKSATPLVTATSLFLSYSESIWCKINVIVNPFRILIRIPIRFYLHQADAINKVQLIPYLLHSFYFLTYSSSFPKITPRNDNS